MALSALNLGKLALSDGFEKFHQVYLLHDDFNVQRKVKRPEWPEITEWKFWAAWEKF